MQNKDLCSFQPLKSHWPYKFNVWGGFGSGIAQATQMMLPHTRGKHYETLTDRHIVLENAVADFLVLGRGVMGKL